MLSHRLISEQLLVQRWRETICMRPFRMSLLRMLIQQGFRVNNMVKPFFALFAMNYSLTQTFFTDFVIGHSLLIN